MLTQALITVSTCGRALHGESQPCFLRNCSVRTNMVQYLFPEGQGKKTPKSPSCPTLGFSFFFFFYCACVVIHSPTPHWAVEGFPCCTWHTRRCWGSWEGQWLGRGSNCIWRLYRHLQKRPSFLWSVPIKTQKAAVISFSRGVPLRRMGENLSLKMVKHGVSLPLVQPWALNWTGWPPEPSPKASLSVSPRWLLRKVKDWKLQLQLRIVFGSRIIWTTQFLFWACVKCCTWERLVWPLLVPRSILCLI